MHKPPSILAHMANIWRRLYRGLPYTVEVFACLTLIVPANATEGGAQSGQPSPPAAAEKQAPGTIAALLAELEKQIAENHMATPQNDNAADTLQAILTLLPNAPLSDSEMVPATFSHFAYRAREAEAAGRYDEAKRFATFGDHSGGTTLNDAAAQPVAARSEAPAVLAGRTSAGHPEMAVEPKPVAARPSPPNAADSGLRLNLATNRLAPAKRTPGGPVVLREAPSATASIDVKPPSAGILKLSEPSASPRVVPKTAAVAAASAPRVAAPPATPRTPAAANTVDPQCRTIAQKFGIGEEPTDEERKYLRRGCQHG